MIQTKVKQTKVWTFINKIPKAEIHLHFEGAVCAKRILALAQKYKINDIQTLLDAQKKLCFTTAQQFFEQFLYVSALLREADDFYSAAYDLGERFEAENIQYVELTFAPHKFMERGISYRDLIQAIDSGLRESPGGGGRQHRIIIDIVRDLGAQAGMRTIRQIEKNPHPSVVGIGLGGSEAFAPQDSAAVYEYAGKLGLRKTAHAGEGVGAPSIWGAIRALQVERIDHGVRAREDSSLVDYLVEKRIPLNLCPTSNLLLGVIPSYAEHPIRAYYEKGVAVNVSTDDPTFFHVTLTEELEKLIEFQGFAVDEIPGLIENTLQASFLDEEEKDQWISRFREETASLRKEILP